MSIVLQPAVQHQCQRVYTNFNRSYFCYIYIYVCVLVMLRNYNDLKSIYALITSIKCRQIFGLGYRDLYVVRGMKGDVDVHVAGIGIGKKQDIRHCKPGCSRLVLNDPNGVLCNLVAERCNDLSYSYAQHTQTKSFIRCFNRFCRIRQEATYRNR